MKKNLIICLILFIFCISLNLTFVACDRQGGNEFDTTAPDTSDRQSENEFDTTAPDTFDRHSGNALDATAQNTSDRQGENVSGAAAQNTSDRQGGKALDATVPNTSKKSESTTKPSSEKYAPYSHTWVHTEYFADREYVYRIILDNDGSAQLVVQDDVGRLIDLSGGSWLPLDGGRLTLDLVTTAADGKELSEGETILFGGVYSATLNKNNNSLTLGVTAGASELAPAQKDGPVTFYDERFAPEKLETLCRAALNYYAEQNGEQYPGRAMVHEIGEDGALIQLGEDMGDHIATGGWYLIDPDTLQGSDEVLGGAIDFSDYAD